MLVSHFCTVWPSNIAIETAAANLGIIGVELFFVLSGYLIGGILFRQIVRSGFTPLDLREFWQRRWYRTLPNYVACLVALVIAWKVMRLPFRDPIWPYFFFLQNLTTNHVGGFFVHSWSLSVEEWMYITLPAAVAVLGSSTRLTSARAALSSTALLCIVPLLLRLIFGLHREWETGLREIVIFRLDAIGYGAILAYVSTFNKSAFTRLTEGKYAALSLIGLALVYISLNHHVKYHATTYTPWPASLWYNGLLFTACSLCIAPIVAYSSTIATSNSRPFALSATVTARYSYSLYLWHVPVLVVIDKYIYLYKGGHRRPVEFAAMVAGTCVVSWLAYHGIEQPFMKLRDRGK